MVVRIPTLEINMTFLVVHANESRFLINEYNAGIGYPKMYRALIKATVKKRKYFYWVVSPSWRFFSLIHSILPNNAFFSGLTQCSLRRQGQFNERCGKFVTNFPQQSPNRPQGESESKLALLLPLIQVGYGLKMLV